MLAEILPEILKKIEEPLDEIKDAYDSIITEVLEELEKQRNEYETLIDSILNNK
jgi:hypothetical protein